MASGSGSGYSGKYSAGGMMKKAAEKRLGGKRPKKNSKMAVDKKKCK